MRKKGAELVFLGELPDGEEVIDFYHAAGHLDTALAAAYGDTHPKRRAQFEKQRHVLLEDYKGVEKVIRSLVYLRDTYPRRKKIARELKYFRRNRHRMRYAALKEQGLPIGSGVTEAACKTLSNATHEEVRNAMGRARRPSHSILPRSRAEQSLRASLDPARTYLQGGGYDSRQCRADTQLAMIGVSMRVTPMRKKGAELVFLGELPDGEEVIDFYHAAGHLDTALAAAYGDTHPKRRAQFEKQRHVLLEDYKGVEKVIRSLVYLRDTYPRRKKIARELKYFRRNRHRMRYAALKEQGLPIGSGVTEAACKTLSNATHEEVRNAMGRARRPSHSILPRSRAEQSLRASLDPARTYLQGGGYDSRQCRADTQLAMIGVSMRVTPNPINALEVL